MSEWNPNPNSAFVDLIDMHAPRREKVVGTVKIRDADTEDAPVQTIARNLILPLPSSALEAAEWGTRCKRQSRGEKQRG